MDKRTIVARFSYSNISAIIQGGLALLIHVVQSGETLWKIAVHYNVTVHALEAVNQPPDPNRLAVGQALVVPVPEMIHPGPKPTIEVNAYTYQLGEAAVPSIEETGRLLTYLSPFAYQMTENGTLASIDDEPAIAAALAQRAVPMMSVTNFTATDPGTELAHTVLSTPEYRENMLSDIVRIMREKGYRGVNIDFENVRPDDRERYNQFLELTVNRLHPLGYFVSTALAPKAYAGQPGLLYEAHDYGAHGRIVDFVVLMTYEWGYRLAPPQAISPINEMRRVVEYAVTAIPREKIFLGFQIYARDWQLPHVEGQAAATFGIQGAVERAVRYGAAIQFDTATQSPFFRYTDEEGRGHEVWFEDARSAQAKFDLVRQYRLRGISYWALGYPFPQNWALLENNFMIRKWI
ncbi:LysM peptidoglycan-binding domain-containing protein [Sporolactobacillus sp. THM7-7]|nr:LysM peptidoglycan-binding domain-containing protein [Sporolactobacillus sp. THM7-7]